MLSAPREPYGRQREGSREKTRHALHSKSAKENSVAQTVLFLLSAALRRRMGAKRIRGPMDLTQKQQEVLDFIQAYFARQGMAPSVREIAGELGKSAQAIQQHIES